MDWQVYRYGRKESRLGPAAWPSQKRKQVACSFIIDGEKEVRKWQVLTTLYWKV